MKNQQGAPEALTLAGAVDHWARGDEMRKAAAELRRLHHENERLAALVEAQQPAPSAASLRVALEQAARQALETLERASDAGYSVECDETITALREALEQVAPRKTEQWNPMNSSNAETALQMAAVIAHRDTEAAHQQAVPQADSQPAPTNTRQIAECYGDCPTDPKTCANPCKFEGRAARAPADSVTAPVGVGVAHALTDAQIEAMPVWRNFVGLWPESRREIVDAVADLLATPPAQAADSVLEDAARLDWLALAGPTSICLVIDRPHDGEIEVATDDVIGYGKTLREALDAARKQGGA